jgi:formyl-CoA transferase
VLKTRTRSDWEELFMEVGVPAGPINNYQQALDHPMAKHQKTRLSLKHPLGVEAPGIASPLKFSKTPVTYRRPPPMLGQHTSEVLNEMGLDQAEIDQLVKSGAIRP